MTHTNETKNWEEKLNDLLDWLPVDKEVGGFRDAVKKLFTQELQAQKEKILKIVEEASGWEVGKDNKLHPKLDLTQALEEIKSI